MNKLFIDTETTGLSPNGAGIIALAYIIEGPEGTVLTEGVIHMNTFHYRTSYSPQALEVNGYTVEQIQQFQHPRDALIEFDAAITAYAPLQLVAYNAEFDKGFLMALYDQYLPRRFNKQIGHKSLCSLQLVRHMQALGIIDTGASQSLAVVAQHFGIEHTPHDTQSDNNAQRAIYNKLAGSIDYARAQIGQYIDEESTDE